MCWMMADSALTGRPPARWQVESQLEIERTRAHVAANRRFLRQMRERMRSSGLEPAAGRRRRARPSD